MTIWGRRIIRAATASSVLSLSLAMAASTSAGATDMQSSRAVALAAPTSTLTISKAVNWDSVPPIPIGPAVVEVSCEFPAANPLPGFPKILDVYEGTSQSVTDLPTGAICDVVETNSRGATVVTMTEVGGATVRGNSIQVVVDADTTVEVTNRYQTGGVKVIKTLSGAGARWAQGPFTFSVHCTDPGRPDVDRELTLTPTFLSDVASPIPAGYECAVTETAAGDAEVVAPRLIDTVQIPYYELVPPGPAVVQADNPYSAGQVTVTKTVTGAAASLVGDAVFTVNVHCERDLIAGGTEVILDEDVPLTAGQSFEVTTPLPMGARCWGTEVISAGAGSSSVDHPDLAGAVTITKATPNVSITATNTYDLTTLSVDKRLAGGPPSAGPFTFTLSCVMPTGKTGPLDPATYAVQLPAEDAAFSLAANASKTVQVPIGSTCTTRETASGGASSVAFTDTSGDPSDGITAMTAAQSVTVTNTFPPAPTVPTTPTVPPAVTPTPTVPPGVTPTPTVPPAVTERTITLKQRIVFPYRSKKLHKADKRKLRAMVADIPAAASVHTTVVGVVRATGAKASDRRRALARARQVASYLKTTTLPGPVRVSNKARTQATTAKARAVVVTITYTVRQ